MAYAVSAGQFSDELTKVLVTPSHTGNVLVSPLSLLTALSMILAGTRGVTKKSLSSTLKLPSNVSQDDVDLYYQNLLSAHESESNERDKLLVRNKVLVSQEYLTNRPLLATYEKTVREKYAASIDPVDFVNSGEAVKNKVNTWVSQSTNGSITDLLKESPAAETVLMLLNCIYFESRWARRFTSSSDANFLVDGVQNKTVEFMNHKNYLKYLEMTLDSSNETVQGVAIPYRTNASMVILLPPDSVSLNQLFNKKLVYTMARKVITEGEKRSIDLTIPRFNFRTDLSVSKYLRQMGEEHLFSPQVDLSGINGAPNLKVSKIQHLTTINVDKIGTKAASTTGIQIDLHSGFMTSDEPFAILLNRPFAFVIYDHDHHLPIFVGKLSDPPPVSADAMVEES